MTDASDATSVPAGESTGDPAAIERARGEMRAARDEIDALPPDAPDDVRQAAIERGRVAAEELERASGTLHPEDPDDAED